MCAACVLHVCCMCAACVLHAGSALAARACRHRVIRLVCSAGWLAHLPAPLVQVAEGSDADVIIFDPSAEHTLGAATHHSAMDTNIYEGYRVTGKVRGWVLSGGAASRCAGVWLHPNCCLIVVFASSTGNRQCSAQPPLLAPPAGSDHHQPGAPGVARWAAECDARQRALCAHPHPWPAVPGAGQAARAPRGCAAVWGSARAEEWKWERKG